MPILQIGLYKYKAMQELKNGETVNLVGGFQAKIVKELGRGGQGIVYLVELGGKQMALKWYLKAPGDAFYKNLQNNISQGAPSDAFLWPEFITLKEKGSYGYIMKLRPSNYYEFGSYLLAKVQFRSFEAMINAAMKITDGFMMLHRYGYSYQDLNDGNFFIDPITGEVLICDNDNVMPQGDKSGILGKARYMAPEIVAGKEIPNKYSDRFSLAVILFMLFYGNHPFEGARVLACPCMTEAYEKKFYGSEAIFIFDENNKENRPVRGVHNNAIKRWPVLPVILKNVFIREFSQDCLQNPTKRLIESEWQKIIQSLRDMMVRCPKCGDETFIPNPDEPTCMNCGRSFKLEGVLKVGNRRLLLTPKTRLYLDIDNKPDVLVVGTPGDRYAAVLQNTTDYDWMVETPSGKLKPVAPNQTMPVKSGLKITFTSSLKGEIE